MSRIKSSALWAFCCCGGLPILGLLKAAIVVVPQTIKEILFVPCIIISLILLPKSVVYTFYTVITTPRLGPNVKIMAFFLVFPMLIIWLLFVAVAALFWGLGTGLVLPVMRTFDSEYNLFFGGIFDVWENGIKDVQRFWEFENEAYYVYLLDYRKPLRNGEKVFEIRIIDVIVGFFIAIIGILVDGVLITIVSILKFLPGLCRAYIELWKLYLDLELCSMLAFFVFFVIANALVPVGCALVLVIAVICGFGVGVEAAYVAYSKSISAAFLQMLIRVRQFDEFTNELIFNSTTSCFALCGIPIDPPR